MAIRQLKDGRWAVYYRKDGKLKWEYFGRGLHAQAAALKRNEELHLAKRRPPKPRSGPTLAELAKAYLAAKHFNANSAKCLALRLSANILPALGHRSAVRLTHQDLDRYVEKRLQKVKASTVRREITDIKAILNWAASTQPRLIPFNPVHNYRPPKPDDAVILPPTREETEAILSAAAPHLRRAILLSYYLGLRPGSVELLRLTCDAVNWENQTILVLSAHKGGPEKRAVPIHPDLLPILRSWYSQDQASGPIIHYFGQPIKSIKRAWASALRRAGITRRLRPYDLRHAFVTQALERGADIKALAEIVGSRPETLMRTYQHVSHELRRRTVEKIPGLDYTKYSQNPNKKGRPKSDLTY